MKSGKKTFIFIACGVTAVFAGLLYLLFGDRFETAEPVIKPIVTSKPAEGDDSAQTALSDSGTTETAVCETPYTEYEMTETVTKITAAFPLDINYASVEELMLLDGIGENLAKSIIAYRNEHGFFRSTEELLNIKGIGQSKLEKIIDCIYVDASLLPETAAEQTSSAAFSADSESKSTSAATTVTEPNKRGKNTEETYASTVTAVTVTETVTTENTYDGIIIEEITDFTDFTSNSRTEYSGSEEYGNNKTSVTSDNYRPNFPLELNTASAKDLAYIDGIGDTIAARIVEYAKSHGFYDVDDLLNVSGIGQGKLQDIRPYVYADSSGLPPRTETTVSQPYDPFGNGNNYTSDWGYAQTQTPQIYRVNVNTGSKADFMQLPGIDETLAESIIDFRNRIGGFEKLEELVLADGMTTGKLSAIWNYIYL